MNEFPDGTVLRLRTSGEVVLFIERDDSWNGDSPQRWFLPTGDAETWEDIRWRLDKAVEWRVVNVEHGVLTAMKALRERFDAALAEADRAPAGGARAELVQVALFVERAAQALAEAACMPAVNWSLRPRPVADPPVVDEPTQPIAPVLETPRPQVPDIARHRARQTLRRFGWPGPRPKTEPRAGDRQHRPSRPWIGVNQPRPGRWVSANQSGRQNEGTW